MLDLAGRRNLVRHFNGTGVRPAPRSCLPHLFGRAYFHLSYVSGEVMAGKAAMDQAWAEAARRRRLSPSEVRMAKELGFKPRSRLKDVPSQAEPWKAPVAEWVRDLYEKRHPAAEQRRRRRERALGMVSPEPGAFCAPWCDSPFQE